MARGVAKPIEEKLQSLVELILEWEDKKNKAQSKINELKAQKQELENEIQAKQFSELQNIMDSSGLTPEQLIELVSKNVNKE